MDPEMRNDGAVYVYNRLCTKKEKQNEIKRVYGRDQHRPHRNGQSGADYSRRTGQRPDSAQTYASGSRPFGMEFAREQMRRAEAAGYGRQRRNPSNAYSYRPGRPGGGEAVKSRPVRLILDRIVNFFESIEDKGRRDEAIAKKHAIAWKKLYDYKHIFITLLAMLAVTALFVGIGYEVFFVVEEVNITGGGIYSDSEIISSAGFEIGDNLYSFAGNEAEEAITFQCPYIKTAEIDRSVPKTVAINIEEDTPVYYSVIWGDCVKLSRGLRVLEVVDIASITEEEGLTEIVLPPVKYSVAGRVIEFCDARDDRIVRNVLREADESDLMKSGMIDEIDMSDEYAITIESCGRFLLKMGNESEMDLKLKMAYGSMTSGEFGDILLPARIDLSVPERASLLPDASLDLSD